jgi:acetate kinase
MHILVFNCGSSSLTFKLFQTEGSRIVATPLAGKAHRVGVKGAEPSCLECKFGGETQRQVMPLPSHGEAARAALDYIASQHLPVDLVGHRFVHGGSLFTESARIEPATVAKLRACLPLASLHNPISLEVIEQTRKALPDVPGYVTFDSAFHASIPPHLYTYALPLGVRQRFGFRRYGFHGLSYAYVTGAAAAFLKRPSQELNTIACHLGTGGSSVAAIAAGQSLDTSMGYSPLPGLVMSTRCGDVDPMTAVYLMATYGYSADELDALLNKESGLLALSGYSSDIRDIIKRVAAGDPEATLAVGMYVQRLRKYVGAYAAELGRVDALIFTDDIGVHNPLVREQVCADMRWCGLHVDPDLNAKAVDDRLVDISASDSDGRILIVPTQEELIICMDGLRRWGGGDDTAA